MQPIQDVVEDFVPGQPPLKLDFALLKYGAMCSWNWISVNCVGISLISRPFLTHLWLVGAIMTRDEFPVNDVQWVRLRLDKVQARCSPNGSPR